MRCGPGFKSQISPIAIAIQANAETLAMDCVLPLRLELSPSPALLREYGVDISAEFNAYFDEAQTYLNCLAAASASAQADVRLVPGAYRERCQ